MDFRAKSNFATNIAEASQVKWTWEEIVLKEYLPYKEVFEKKTFDELPPRRPWDHTIEVIPGSKMVDCKIYPLNPDQQKQLDEFLKEQLETGRIQSSYGITLFLCKEERWIITTCTRLSKTK